MQMEKSGCTNSFLMKGYSSGVNPNTEKMETC